MKKTTAAFLLTALLAACQSWNQPSDEEVFVVRDDEPAVDQWAVDGVSPITESYLYAIDTKVYEVVARRTTNKLLNYTAPIYNAAERPTIFVGEAQVFDQDLPDGFAYARKITKDMLDNAKAFLVVNTPEEADYFLDINVETVLLEGSQTPVIIYSLTLLDSQEEILQEWKETIRQVKNDDQTWW